MRDVLVDPQTLKQFEDDLKAAEAELQSVIERATAPLMPRIESLRLIVQGMRGLVAVDGSSRIASGIEAPARPATDRGRIVGEVVAVPHHGAVSKMTYGGKPSIPAVILDVLSHLETDVDTIYGAVCAHSAYEDGKTPSRGSVTNRLNDMAKRGEIVKVNSKTYRSLPPDGGADIPSQIAAGIAANGTDHKLAPEPEAPATGAGQEMRLEVGSR